jgi:hypothetical protein
MKFSGTMPDLTPAQLVAALTWVVSQAVAFKVLDTQTSQLVLSVGSTAIVAAWKIADAIIRNGRAKALAVKATAPEPPVTTVNT